MTGNGLGGWCLLPFTILNMLNEINCKILSFVYYMYIWYFKKWGHDYCIICDCFNLMYRAECFLKDKNIWQCLFLCFEPVVSETLKYFTKYWVLVIPSCLLNDYLFKSVQFKCLLIQCIYFQTINLKCFILFD